MTSSVQDLTARLRRLEDRAELADLVAAYAQGLDGPDIQLLRRICLPEVRARHGEVFEPLEGIEAFIAQVEHFAPRWDAVTHHVSHVAVELDGDGGVVHATVIAVHAVTWEDEPQLVPAGARYAFTARRTVDGWRFSELHIIETWADTRIARLYGP